MAMEEFVGAVDVVVVFRSDPGGAEVVHLGIGVLEGKEVGGDEGILGVGPITGADVEVYGAGNCLRFANQCDSGYGSTLTRGPMLSAGSSIEQYKKTSRS